jgi:hypothetical protein
MGGNKAKRKSLAGELLARLSRQFAEGMSAAHGGEVRFRQVARRSLSSKASNLFGAWPQYKSENRKLATMARDLALAS